jgi:hypothetical protein
MLSSISSVNLALASSVEILTGSAVAVVSIEVVVYTDIIVLGFGSLTCDLHVKPSVG